MQRPQNIDVIAVSQVDGSKDEEKIKKWLPEAKSIVVLAAGLLSGPLFTSEIRHAMAEFKVVDENLAAAARELAAASEELGFRALPIPPYYPLDMSATAKGMIGDISLRHAAVRASIGIIGRNGLLVTPKWGSAIRLAAVLCEAPPEIIPADDTFPVERIKGICDSCNLCADHCPAGAITERGVNIKSCIAHVGGPYGLKSLTKHALELSGAVRDEPEKVHSLINSEKAWNFYQNFMMGVYFNCVECIKMCPVHRLR